MKVWRLVIVCSTAWAIILLERYCLDLFKVRKQARGANRQELHVDTFGSTLHRAYGTDYGK